MIIITSVYSSTAAIADGAFRRGAGKPCQRYKRRTSEGIGSLLREVSRFKVD